MVPDISLLQKLTPETRVLIWTHSAPLDLNTPGLATVDYLLDGLVTGHIKAHTEKPSHHVVFSHLHYGQSFWVGFVDVKHTSPNSFLTALKAVLPTNSAAQATIYSGTESHSDWDKALRGHFKQIENYPIA